MIFPKIVRFMKYCRSSW